MSRFKEFITNTEFHLKSHLKKGELEQFSSSLISFYPTAARFYSKETEELLKQHGLPKLLIQIRKASAALISKYKSYDVQVGQVVLEKHDNTQETHPLIDVVDFLKDGLNIKEETSGFFLIASFLTNPMNYDFIQLCRVYLSKT
jgi:hypothetical protein